MKYPVNTRPFQPGDIVRIKQGIPGKTGVILEISEQSANVNITSSIHAESHGRSSKWFNFRDLNRIGKIRTKWTQIPTL